MHERVTICEDTEVKQPSLHPVRWINAKRATEPHVGGHLLMVQQGNHGPAPTLSQHENQALKTGTETRRQWVSSLKFASGIVPSPGKPGHISVEPSRHEHRSDVHNRSNTNQGPVSVLRNRETATSREWGLLDSFGNHRGSLR